MKCDLHVHSAHSGTVPVAMLRHFFLESYSPPADVYATLRNRGMDLITLTDAWLHQRRRRVTSPFRFFCQRRSYLPHAQRDPGPCGRL